MRSRFIFVVLSLAATSVPAVAQQSSRPGRVIIDDPQPRCLNFLPASQQHPSCAQRSNSNRPTQGVDPIRQESGPDQTPTNQVNPIHRGSAPIITTHGTCGSLGGVRHITNRETSSAIRATIQERVTHNGETSVRQFVLNVPAGGRTRLGCSSEWPSTGGGALRRVYTILGSAITN
jgi:hypothetical protein